MNGYNFLRQCRKRTIILFLTAIRIISRFVKLWLGWNFTENCAEQGYVGNKDIAVVRVHNYSKSDKFLLETLTTQRVTDK